MNAIKNFQLTTLPRRFLLASAVALALLSSPAKAVDKLPVTVPATVPVTASFSILADIVRVVGGERVSVTTLVGPDQDAHIFEPKPADAKAILTSKLLVTNGLNFEPWVAKLVKAAGYKGQTVVASQGVQVLAKDPHAWQNPRNVIIYTRNIAAALSQVDADGASTYQAHADAYIKELQALDAWAQEQIATLPKGKRKVITSHDAFGYFAAQYGVTFLAPVGINTETQPSAKQVAQLIQQMQREKIRAVFVENMSNPKLIAQLSKDTGATVGASLYADALSSADKPGATYLQMMRHNVTQLVAGMKLN
jgi:zinc/manganese transport system substrate-binding protein